MRLEKGEVIGARYSLVRAIGEGGMGAVWAALDTKTNELVALKVLRDEVKVPEVIRRFLREARAAMAVRHPNVVRIREVIMVDAGGAPMSAQDVSESSSSSPSSPSSSPSSEPVIVMDFLEGESLRARLERVERIPLHTFAQMFVPVVSAIGTAHAAGVVHRDLKPDNIFLLRMPEGREEPRVVDFGIAKLTAIEGDAKQSGHLTTTGAVLGTPYYMSPEQVFGDKHIDHRTDIWSLGTIVFECLSGQRPVEGDNIGQILKVITTGGIPKLEVILPGLPPDVYEVVGRMLSFDRTKRPSDLREVLDIFQRHTTQAAPAFGAATLPIGAASASPHLGKQEDTSPFAATLGFDSSSHGAVGSANGNVYNTPNAHGAYGAPYGASTTGGAAMAAASSSADRRMASSSPNHAGRIIAIGVAGLVFASAAGIAISIGVTKKRQAREASLSGSVSSMVAVGSQSPPPPPLPVSSDSNPSLLTSASASTLASGSAAASTAPPPSSIASAVTSLKPAAPTRPSAQANKGAASVSPTSASSSSSSSPASPPSAVPAKTGAPIAPKNPYEQ